MNATFHGLRITPDRKLSATEIRLVSELFSRVGVTIFHLPLKDKPFSVYGIDRDHIILATAYLVGYLRALGASSVEVEWIGSEESLTFDSDELDVARTNHFDRINQQFDIQFQDLPVEVDFRFQGARLDDDADARQYLSQLVGDIIKAAPSIFATLVEPGKEFEVLEALEDYDVPNANKLRKYLESEPLIFRRSL